MASSIRFGAAGALAVLAATEIAWGLATAPIVAVITADGPSPAPGFGVARLGITALVYAGFSVVIAALTGLAAIGIASGHRYGWWAGLAGAVLWLPTGCAPGSLVALGLLLLPDVRAVAFPPPAAEG